jgi:hypothetical protein
MKMTRRMFSMMLLGLLTSCASDPPAGGHWELLGHREVDFHVDHDTIEVGKEGGHFAMLRFDVHGGAIEVYDVKVILGNGEIVRLPSRLVLEPGEGRMVDLPGDRRTVRRVEFVYRSLKGDSHRATVSLYGR